MVVNKYAPILIVDDDSNLRHLLREILTNLGFHTIHEAENGQNAWATLLHVEIGLLISDVNMPGMDGLQLARKVRSKPKFDEMPILIVTVANNKETILEAVKAKIDGYILKPFEIGQIMEKIQEAFSKRAKLAAAKDFPFK